jgi:hypothetical protein
MAGLCVTGVNLGILLTKEPGQQIKRKAFISKLVKSKMSHLPVYCVFQA